MKINIQNIWNNAEWTSQARSMIQGLNRFSQDSKIFLFIRHSHRKESFDANELEKLSLTELGFEVAKKFGSYLPKNRALKILYSHSPRCKETAEKIIEGFHEIGGQYNILGTNSPVNYTKSSNNFITLQSLKYGEIEFIQRWHNNKFSKNDIIPFYDYCTDAFKFAKKILEKTQGNEIITHVTHDIFIMALRYGWFESPIKYNWPSYLGGFAISFGIGGYFLLDVEKEIPEPIKANHRKYIPLFNLNHKKGGDKNG